MDAGVGETILTAELLSAMGEGAAIGGGLGALSGAVSGGGDKIWKNALLGAGTGMLGGAAGQAFSAGAEGAASAPNLAAASAENTQAMDTMARAGLSFDQQQQILSAAKGAGDTTQAMDAMTRAGLNFDQQQQIFNAMQTPLPANMGSGAGGFDGITQLQPQAQIAPQVQAAQVPAEAPQGAVPPTQTPQAPAQAPVQAPKTVQPPADKGIFGGYGAPLAIGAGTLGVGALLKSDQNRYGVPAQQKYSGPLSKFKYDPSTYTPAPNPTPIYPTVGYANGGIAALATGGDPQNPMSNTIYPQSQQEHTNFATSTQYPVSMKSAMAADYDTRTNPATGQELPMGMARGGIASLGGYSDGGRMLKGPGDGVSDSIPASIGGKQPARLADGEFVVPARAVSELGNGSTDAGAKQLYAMLSRIESKRKKGKGLAYQANPKNMMPA